MWIDDNIHKRYVMSYQIHRMKIEDVYRELKEILEREIEECERLSREAYALGDPETGKFFKEMAEQRKEDLKHLL